MTHQYDKLRGWPVWLDITITQGDQYEILPLWLTVDSESGEALPMDLAGWNAKMQIRRAPGSEVIAEYSTDNARILLPEEGQDQVEEWETSGIYVFADSTTKWNIWVMVPAMDTKALPAGVYQYDLKLTPPGNPGGRMTFYKGSCCIEAEVTQ